MSVVLDWRNTSIFLMPKEFASEFDNLRKTIIHKYLEKYCGIDAQLKVINLEF
jgi:hypothetical protein